jgi:hypothetical protein
METFGKACRERPERSATVTRVGRFAAVLGSLCLLVCGGCAAVLLASGPAPAASTTTGSTATVTTGATTTVASTASSVLAISGHGGVTGSA